MVHVLISMNVIMHLPVHHIIIHIVQIFLVHMNVDVILVIQQEVENLKISSCDR